jgi:hypothetical protein
MVCQDISLLLYLDVRSIWVPCLERGVVILEQRCVDDAKKNHRRVAYLRLAHGNIFIHNVTDRARLLAQCNFGITRLFPLRVYLRIDTLLFCKEVVRVLLRLQRSVSCHFASEQSRTYLLLESDLFL